VARNRDVEWERTPERATAEEVWGSGCRGGEPGDKADADALARNRDVEWERTPERATAEEV